MDGTDDRIGAFPSDFLIDLIAESIGLRGDTTGLPES